MSLRLCELLLDIVQVLKHLLLKVRCSILSNFRLAMKSMVFSQSLLTQQCPVKLGQLGLL